MDENKDIPNEETQATPEQPAEVKEEPDVAEEVAQESVQQEPEPTEADETVIDVAETPLQDAPSEETAAQSSDEGQAPTSDETETPPSDELPQENQTETTEQEPVPQSGEARVEMLDAEQKPAEGEQLPAEAAVSPSSDLCPPSCDVPPSSDESPTMESVIEAVLFATDEPLPESKLAGIVETTGKQIRESIENLNAKYQASRNAFRIEQIAGGYQMLTQPIYNSWLKKMVKVRSDNKLSPAAMETLAIIAYKQPIIRADIEAIRGVAVGEVIRSLMYKGLVKIAGRAEILGRPMLYGTTKKFLEVFGLNSVKDLPKAEDLKNPDRV